MNHHDDSGYTGQEGELVDNCWAWDNGFRRPTGSLRRSQQAGTVRTKREGVNCIKGFG